MSARLRPGFLITDSLKIRKFLGEGAWGEVWSAEEVSLGTTYAVKRLSPRHAQVSDALLAEIEAWIGLPVSPQLARCYFWTLGPAREILIVVELVCGGSLRDRLEEGALATTESLLCAAIQIADGLTLVHESGFVHGDLSPSNILSDEQGRLKLTDFGLASSMNANPPARGGTALYRGPEAAGRGSRTSRTDIWSLGLLLMEMFLGYCFWSTGLAARTITKDARRQEPLWPRPADCRRKLLSLAASCFHSVRYPSARHLGASLRELFVTQCGQPFSVAPPSSPTVAPDRALRRLNELQYQVPQQSFEKARQRFGLTANLPHVDCPLVPQRRALAVADARYFARLAAFYRERLEDSTAAEYLDILTQQALALEASGNYQAAAFAYRRLISEARRLDPARTRFSIKCAWALAEFAKIRLLQSRRPEFSVRLFSRAIAWAQRYDAANPTSADRQTPYFLIQKATACRVLFRLAEARALYEQAIALLEAVENAGSVSQHELAYAHLGLARCFPVESAQRLAAMKTAIDLWQALVDGGCDNYLPSLVHAKFESIWANPLRRETASMQLANVEQLEPQTRAIDPMSPGRDLPPTLPRLLIHKARCLSLLDRDPEACLAAGEAIALYEESIVKTGSFDLRQEYGNACTWLAQLYCAEDCSTHNADFAAQLAHRGLRVWEYLAQRRPNPQFLGRVIVARMTLALALSSTLPLSPDSARQLAAAEREWDNYRRLGHPPLPSFVATMRDSTRQALKQIPKSPTPPARLAMSNPRSSAGWLPAGYRSLRKLPSNPQMHVRVARQMATGQTVVVKSIRPNRPVTAANCQRFEREIWLLRQLQHPRLVRFLESGSDTKGSWLIMEHLPCGDLDGWLARRRSPVSPQRALAIIDQVLVALEFLHDLPTPVTAPALAKPLRQIVHRDVKPGNILLVDKQATQVKLADFGFAKALELAGYSGVTASNVRGGTCWFSARSLAGQFRDAPPSVDVWSAAATLFYLLTREPPRNFDDAGDEWLVVLRRRARPIRTLRSDLPDRLAEVIDAALFERPASPLDTASGLRAALTDAAKNMGITFHTHD